MSEQKPYRPFCAGYNVPEVPEVVGIPGKKVETEEERKAKKEALKSQGVRFIFGNRPIKN